MLARFTQGVHDPDCTGCPCCSERYAAMLLTAQARYAAGYAPPDSYAPALAKLRAAAAPVVVESFADRWKRERLAQLDAERERTGRWMAEHPLPRNLAADDAKYRSPNGYTIALAKRLAAEKRRGNN